MVVHSKDYDLKYQITESFRRFRNKPTDQFVLVSQEDDIIMGVAVITNPRKQPQPLPLTSLSNEPARTLPSEVWRGTYEPTGSTDELMHAYTSAPKLGLQWLGSMPGSKGHGSAVLNTAISTVHAAGGVLLTLVLEDDKVCLSEQVHADRPKDRFEKLIRFYENRGMVRVGHSQPGRQEMMSLWPGLEPASASQSWSLL